MTLLLLLGSCSQDAARQYELTGHVVAIDPSAREVTIAHDRVAGLMDPMTMPFRVDDPSMLAGLVPDDLIRGHLVVRPDAGYLVSIEKAGSRIAPAVTPAERERRPQHGLLLEGDLVPDTILIDQHGRRRGLRETPPRATVLTFVYTRCPLPTFCPLIDHRFKQIQEIVLADGRLSSRVRLVSVTLDHTHDTPAVLARHAQRLGADSSVWTFARPDEAVPGAFAGRFGVTGVRDDRDVSTLAHRLATVAIDRQGIVARIFRGSDWRPDQVIDLLRSVVAADASRTRQ